MRKGDRVTYQVWQFDRDAGWRRVGREAVVVGTAGDRYRVRRWKPEIGTYRLGMIVPKGQVRLLTQCDNGKLFNLLVGEVDPA